MENKFNVIDLFCGCGGLSNGLEQAGFNTVAGFDNDVNSLKSFSFNHKKSQKFLFDLGNIYNSKHKEMNFNNDDTIEEKNIQVSNLNDLKSIISEEDIFLLCGGPPCQGFSSVNAKTRFMDNPKNILFKSYIEFIQAFEPEFILLENVMGLKTLEDGKVLNDILKTFKNIGYNSKCFDANAADYGVPQLRKRVFIIGSRNENIDLSFPLPTHKKPSNQSNLFTDSLEEWTTVGDAIKDIPSDNPNHIKYEPADIVKERMSKIKPGENKKVLSEKLQPNTNFNNTYGRLDPNKPSFTIHTRFDTASTGELYHPYENRALTVREGARIQSFKDEFTIFGNKGSQFRQIGNAVPPKLAKAIGIHIIEKLMK
tara:strand:+ start:128 stop:1231 length:1104 start_codon:yes stop_codon:yes gene_type:complete